MDETFRLFLVFVLGVLTPYIRKSLEFVVRKSSVQMRKINDGRKLRIQNEHSAEKAVKDALDSWDFAEYECEENTKQYFQAYGGQYRPISVKIECWKVVVTKCYEAARHLEENNETFRASTFRNNASIATKIIKDLENHTDRNLIRYVVAIDEAKRREYDAKLAKSHNDDFMRIRRASTYQDAKAN